MLTTRKGLLVIMIALFMSGIFSLDKIKDKFSTKDGVTISEARKGHILRGDATGGGHQFGTGKPCKSEFPKEWNSDEIIDNIELIASNDNLPWKKQTNGYYVTEEMVDGVKIRVVLNRNQDEVITAYPTNIKRNPCPAAANDNNRD